jgi:hypothetical protein
MQPGGLLEIRGFPSPSRDGFGCFQISSLLSLKQQCKKYTSSKCAEGFYYNFLIFKLNNFIWGDSGSG